MSFLGLLHSYEAGGVIDSSDWNDELNQLLALLGSAVVANPNVAISIKDQIDGGDSILKLDNQLTGNIFELTNGTITSILTNTGQLQLGANGVVGLIISSDEFIQNLNADFLDGKTSADLETKLFSFQSFSVFSNSVDLLAFAEKERFIANSDCIITKLKIKQEGVATADADTEFDIRKNGLSIGTIAISGNTTAVQTNDIGDVNLTTGDVISFIQTVYDGTTKHVNVTVAIHFKNKYNG